jgi:hypothetical protein
MQPRREIFTVSVLRLLLAIPALCLRHETLAKDQFALCAWSQIPKLRRTMMFRQGQGRLVLLACVSVGSAAACRHRITRSSANGH